jgi:hypothetical protein
MENGCAPRCNRYYSTLKVFKLLNLSMAEAIAVRADNVIG